MDLFAEHTAQQQAPLAARMRPQSINEVAGQAHLVGEGAPVRRLIEQGRPRSLILWGPPGTGKTTLAEVIAHEVRARFVRLSAVMAGVKEIRAEIEQARAAQGRGEATMLFIDEIHRLNKAQQDSVLPHVESGLIHILGATTENPSFEVNGALLSRCRVLALKPLEATDLLAVLERALADRRRGLGEQGLSVEAGGLEVIAQASGGDARRALGMLETAADFATAEDEGLWLGIEAIRSAIGEGVAVMDKSGDAYYDLLSAIHKSIRSSRPDAALFYIARFTTAGGDPLDVIRRLTAVASEDVGNADPRALPLAIAAWDAYLRLGQYEGERAIAHAATHLAIAPKSGAIDAAWKRARQLAAEHPRAEPPRYLRNAPTTLMADQGNRVGYRYAHDEPHGYPAGSAHDCWPEAVPKEILYAPGEQGSEQRIQALLAWRSELDAQADAASAGTPDGAGVTFPDRS